jgi:twitching motility two-component system response regulator PilH
MARVTVVNDNPEFLELMDEVLEGERHDTTPVPGDREDALDLVLASRPELLIIDLRMSREGLRGWDLAQEVRRDPQFAHLPVLLCSADLQALSEIEASLEGQREVEALAKPFGIDELTQTVDRLLARSNGD